MWQKSKKKLQEHKLYYWEWPYFSEDGRITKVRIQIKFESMFIFKKSSPVRENGPTSFLQQIIVLYKEWYTTKDPQIFR